MGIKVLIAAIPQVEDAKLDFKTPLTKAGFEVVDLGPMARRQDPALTRELPDTEVLIPGNLLQVDAPLLEQCPRLRLIAKPGAGLDNVDLGAATRAGIPVCFTPGVNAQAVADHTWALILNLVRRINELDQAVRRGQWRKLTGTQAWRKTLGIIGLGAIGRAVASRAYGFEMQVIGYDPLWPEPLSSLPYLNRVELDELLTTADIVSIHCPLTDATRGLIGASQLARMKPSAFLINTARGHIVDEAALAEALEAGTIAGAGLDAFACEPLNNSPLTQLANVVLTPHAAWLTREALEDTVAETVACIQAVMRGERPRWAANPELWP